MYEHEVRIYSRRYVCTYAAPLLTRLHSLATSSKSICPEDRVSIHRQTDTVVVKYPEKKPMMMNDEWCAYVLKTW
jgi:hypothetical protein